MEAKAPKPHTVSTLANNESLETHLMRFHGISAEEIKENQQQPRNPVDIVQFRSAKKQERTNDVKKLSAQQEELTAYSQQILQNTVEIKRLLTNAPY